jgi:glyoxylase-like metal-dependent hydrolase (beta-lactamase superfamily II)
MIPAGPANTFLLDSPDGCTLIDCGLPGGHAKIVQAIKQLGKKPKDVHHILLTHAHPDHIGGFAAVKRDTGAEAYMHSTDAPIAISGAGFRPMKAAPGLRRAILFRLFVRLIPVEGAPIERYIEDGQQLPFAGGLTAIHIPGHCAGQLAFLWHHHGGVLFAADACSNMMGLGWSLGYENFQEGQRSLRKLSAMDFQIACFGHGKPILKDASRRFKKLWL